MPANDNIGYTGPSKLMDNYGWVQNTSNLSTVRDTIDLVPDEGIDHNSLMRAIYFSRRERGDLKSRWTWDARCRIKAICATGMAQLDRTIAGYALTELGRSLKACPKSALVQNGKRALSPEEIDVYRNGLLTNPPVIRVLSVLNNSRRNGNIPLSKYDVGAQLGFVGDIGFTHLEPEYVASIGKSFNDKEGDADKWARTIISWLVQVGWAVASEPVTIMEKPLPRYTTTIDVDRVLQYAARSAIKYIPQEMLCSHHHAFPKVVQKRRVAILEALSGGAPTQLSDLLVQLTNQGIEISEEVLRFDLINLKQAGIGIENEQSFYRLADRISLDINTEDGPVVGGIEEEVERSIEHYVAEYAETLPPRIIDGLIRYGYGGTETAALFEATVSRFFTLMGYESEHLGQGHGRVADVIAKYRGIPNPRSYGLIIDAKAYRRYSFPASDIRKMKEYIEVHGIALLEDHIPHHAFAFVSMDFNNPDAPLQEIADATAVDGTAITVDELLKFGDQVAQNLIDIGDCYPLFTTNTTFCLT